MHTQGEAAAPFVSYEKGQDRGLRGWVRDRVGVESVKS